MSSHAHGAPAGDHVPHVLPLKVYFGVFFMLLVFTVLTVAVSYVDLGQTLNLIVALLVAGAKATMVAAIFMHLAFDKKFNSIIISSSVVFVVLLVLVTMQDTDKRGAHGGKTYVEGDRPADPAKPFGTGARQSEQRIINTWAPEKAK